MTRKKKVPAAAKPRECPECHKAFRSMTDAQWRWNLMAHRTTSLDHKRKTECG